MAKGLISEAQLEGAKLAVEQRKAKVNEAKVNWQPIKPK
jgi:hypothetical protein